MVFCVCVFVCSDGDDEKEEKESPQFDTSEYVENVFCLEKKNIFKMIYIFKKRSNRMMCVARIVQKMSEEKKLERLKQFRCFKKKIKIEYEMNIDWLN